MHEIRYIHLQRSHPNDKLYVCHFLFFMYISKKTKKRHSVEIPFSIKTPEFHWITFTNKGNHKSKEHDSHVKCLTYV